MTKKPTRDEIWPNMVIDEGWSQTPEGDGGWTYWDEGAEDFRASIVATNYCGVITNPKTGEIEPVGNFETLDAAQDACRAAWLKQYEKED
jgi:hypothetical protein